MSYCLIKINLDSYEPTINDIEQYGIFKTEKEAEDERLKLDFERSKMYSNRREYINKFVDDFGFGNYKPDLFDTWENFVLQYPYMTHSPRSEDGFRKYFAAALQNGHPCSINGYNPPPPPTCGDQFHIFELY